MLKELLKSRPFFVLLITFLSCQLFLAGQQSSSDSYLIRFDSEESKIVHVEANLTLEDDTLRMSDYGPMPERWPDYVKNLEVRDDEGQVRAVEKKEAKWIIANAEPGAHIQLSYDLHIDHEEINWPGGIDGVAFVRTWGLMLSGRSLFVVNGSDKEDIKVQVELPDACQFSAPWNGVAGIPNTFVVKNHLQLQESLLFAGTHKEIIMPRGDFKLKFVLGGEEILAKEKEYVDTAEKVLDYYIQ